MSVVELSNRVAIALRLADVLAAHGADAEAVAALPDAGWAMAAALADCRPGYIPSSATRAAVVSALVERFSPTDPFSGWTA